MISLPTSAGTTSTGGTASETTAKAASTEATASTSASGSEYGSGCQCSCRTIILLGDGVAFILTIMTELTLIYPFAYTRLTRGGGHYRMVTHKTHGNGMAFRTFRIFQLFGTERVTLHYPTLRTYPYVIVNRLYLLLEILRRLSNSLSSSSLNLRIFAPHDGHFIGLLRAFRYCHSASKAGTRPRPSEHTAIIQ